MSVASHGGELSLPTIGEQVPNLVNSGIHDNNIWIPHMKPQTNKKSRQEGKYFCCMFLHNSFLSHSNIVPKRSTNVHLCTQCAKLGYLAGDKYTVNRQVLISRELHCMFMLEVRVRRLNLYVWTWTNVKHTDWFKEERCPLQDFPRFPFMHVAPVILVERFCLCADRCICIEITWHFICVCLIDRSSYEAASLFIWSSIASC